MAEVVQCDWCHLNGKSKRKHSRFPWEQWANGKTWKVTKGDDFNSTALRFRQRLYTRAKEFGMKVRTKVIDKKTVAFQFFKPNQIPWEVISGDN